MNTKDELFQDECGKSDFSYLVCQAANLRVHVTPSHLVQIFDQLPDSIQDSAFRWGLSDAIFQDEAWTYLDKHGIQPEVEIQVESFDDVNVSKPTPALRVPKMADVMDAIHKVTYTVLPSGRVTICEITLYHDKGHCVFGHSAVVHETLFDKKMGEEAAYKRAVDKVWDYVAYNIHQSMIRGSV